MRNAELKLPENPYASPEEVVEEERWSSQERMLAGLWWLKRSAAYAVWMYGVQLMMAAVLVAGYAPLAAVIGVFVLLCLVCLSGVCALLGTWRCLQDTPEDDAASGRGFLFASWVLWVVAGGLMLTFWLAPVSVVLVFISFRQWYRYLAFAAEKIQRPDIARLAFDMFRAGVFWGVLVALLVILVFLIDTSYLPEPDGYALAPAVIVLCVVPAVYFLLEFIVLSRLRRGVEEMRNEE